MNSCQYPELNKNRKTSKFSETQPSNMGGKISIIFLYSQFCRCRKDWQQVISYSAVEIRFEFRLA